MIAATTIQKIILPKHRCILFVSDIHAHLDWFKSLLHKVRFSIDDILFVVGDLLERGTQNLATVRYLMELQKTHTVYVSMGNVDAWMMDCFQEDSGESIEQIFEELTGRNQVFGGSLFAEVSRELGLPLEGPQDLSALRTAFQRELSAEFQYLCGLPTMIETQRFLCVHGGVPHTNTNALAGTDPVPYLKNDGFAAKGLSFDNYVIVGHCPTVMLDKRIACYLPYINEERRIICLDGGCGVKQEGQLNVLILSELDASEFSWDFWDDLPVYIAVDPQSAGERSINITYDDNRVRILDRTEADSLVEHCSSGYRLRIGNEYLRDLDGPSPSCQEYTDLLLPITPGDRLSVIQKTPKGYRVKKDGIEGWYLGRLAE